jgi:hypothetical protein
MRIAPFVTLLFPTLLAACASELSNPLVGGFFADPGQYEFFSCEQLAPQRAYWSARMQELKLLMDKAEKGTGGAVVSVVAYKGEYVAAHENLQVVEATARMKKCTTPENWGSTSAVRRRPRIADAQCGGPWTISPGAEQPPQRRRRA